MIKFQVLNLLCTPSVAHPGDAGIDLRASEDYFIYPARSCFVKLGVKAEIPQGWVGLLFSRSGLGGRGIRLGNCVGVIDSGFRGEMQAIIYNDGTYPFKIEPGDRIAQLVVVPHYQVPFELVEELSDTVRGQNGYGSSGIK